MSSQSPLGALKMQPGTGPAITPPRSEGGLALAQHGAAPTQLNHNPALAPSSSSASDNSVTRERYAYIYTYHEAISAPYTPPRSTRWASFRLLTPTPALSLRVPCADPPPPPQQKPLHYHFRAAIPPHPATPSSGEGSPCTPRADDPPTFTSTSRTSLLPLQWFVSSTR